MPPEPSCTNGALRGLVILGSTGSIGTQTLEVVRLFPDRFRVRALTAHANAELLLEQARAFRPELVVIGEAAKVPALEERLRGLDVRVRHGEQGLCEAAALEGADVVVAAVVGVAGLEPVVAAIRQGKTIALANKETLVVGGALVNGLLEEYGATLVPVDSEHSAIFQCLVGEPPESIEALTLTASGGPFRTRDPKTFAAITPEEALRHPNWSMGAKITIDSATMMNKGLEVIEARWLFHVEADRIEVLVHPQSIIHSMVTFLDGSAKAQLGVPDMKVPIQYALSYPERWAAPHERIDWARLRCLDFAPPDPDVFPCLRLAYDALRSGGTAPAVLNAANEEAVALFLSRKIRFTDIPRLIEDALERLAETSRRPGGRTSAPSLEALHEADVRTRRHVQEHARALAN